MDCPSEERLIRVALEPVDGVEGLDCDLGRREVRVRHRAATEPVTAALGGLGLGARLIATRPAAPATTGEAEVSRTPDDERRVLFVLLGINSAMFVVEAAAGWIGESAGLLSDSLDMFADATVYGLALLAVGAGVARKVGAARAAGWLQAVLAMAGLFEVVRRFFVGSDPEPPVMIGVALLALLANVGCVALLARFRHGAVHMKASWIFSTNDVIANLGVMIAGAAVAWTGSHYPDLIIGAIVALVVFNGARRILRLR